MRSALTFGGLKGGMARENLLYNKNRVFAFVLAPAIETPVEPTASTPVDISGVEVIRGNVFGKRRYLLQKQIEELNHQPAEVQNILGQRADAINQYNWPAQLLQARQEAGLELKPEAPPAAPQPVPLIENVPPVPTTHGQIGDQRRLELVRRIGSFEDIPASMVVPGEEVLLSQTHAYDAPSKMWVYKKPGEAIAEMNVVVAANNAAAQGLVESEKAAVSPVVKPPPARGS